jgi:hypothetical protein
MLKITKTKIIEKIFEVFTKKKKIDELSSFHSLIPLGRKNPNKNTIVFHETYDFLLVIFT